MSSHLLLFKTYEKNFPLDKEGLASIKKALDFARRIHRGQKRASGHPYVDHVVATALTLAQWRLDATSIIAGLLHDSIEDCGISAEQLSQEFGEEVSFLVEGVSRLGHLRYHSEQEGSESLRKMMLAVSKDLRVIFIKLADRLHNMQTLSHLPTKKQKRIAQETIEIYAAIADRLGMQHVAGDLKDLAFPYIHPDQHQWIRKNITESYEEREAYIKKIEPLVQGHLQKASINPLSIDYRAKRMYSLYKKLLRYDMNVENIYDLVAMRIIVDTVDECYSALGIIHQLWPPMPGRIKDYIALPKPNGYQSLHTTVFCVDNRPTEFQIRTAAMHEFAEEGAAAHWFYELQKGRSSTPSLNRQEVEWIRQLKDWQNQFPGSQEFIDALKIDLFSDRIFVLTPKGRVVDLPAGATPIDFAYHIHTDVGNSCIGAKVNNKIVPFDHTLQSGDMVEILTQKNKKPSAEWVRMVRTGYAKKKIKSAIKRTSSVPKKTEFRLTCENRIGMMKDVSGVFSRSHIGIDHIHSTTQKGFVTLRIVVDISDQEKAQRMLLKLKKLPGVREISLKIIASRF